jgi:hypothetical protein
MESDSHRKENAMKNTPFVKATIVAAGLTFGTINLTAAQKGNDLNLRTENVSNSTATQSNLVTHNWIEEHLRGKLGRYSADEETRIQELQSSSAFREEPSAAPPTVNWVEQHQKMKQGQ